MFSGWVSVFHPPEVKLMFLVELVVGLSYSLTFGFLFVYLLGFPIHSPQAFTLFSGWVSVFHPLKVKLRFCLNWWLGFPIHSLTH